MKKKPRSTVITTSEASALFSSIIESPKDVVIFALDRSYCYTAFNSSHRKTMKKIWGVDIEIGMNMLEAIGDPVDREKARRNFDRALRGESFTFLEEYGEPPNRFYYEDSYNPVFDESGNVIGISLFLTDVTEKIKDNEELDRYRARLEEMVRKRTAELEIANNKLEQELTRRRQTERTLHDRETFLKGVLSSIQDGISVLDTDMTIQYNNPVMALWFADKTPLVGKKCYDCYWDLDKFCDPCPALRCIKSGKTETDIIRGIQGSPVEWLEVSCFPMEDAETGKLTGVVEFMRDITDRKRTEDQLINSETFNRTVLSSIQEGFIVFDRNLNYLVWNPYMEKISGLKAAEVIGKNVYNLLPFIKEKNLDVLLKKALKGETYKSPDFQYRIPDTGREGWAQSIYSPHRDLEGNIIGVVVVVRDITRRKMIEQEITTWADALKSIHECVSVTDTENNLIFINRAFTQTYGYTADEILGRKIFEVAGSSKNPPEVTAEILSATLKGGWQGELINRRKDGSEFPISLSTSPVFNEQNEVVALIGVSEDITKRNAIRAALKESEERYRTLFDYSNYAIFLHDLTGKIKDLNRQAVKLFGYSRSELLKLAVHKLHPDSEAEKSKAIFTAIQTTGAEQFEINFKRKDGYIFPAEVSSKIVKVGDEKLILGIVHDITARKTAQAALLEREKLLRTIAENYPNSYLSIVEKDLTISYSAGQEFKKQNLDPEQFNGLTVEDVFGQYGKEILSKVKSAYQKTFSGEEQSFEILLNGQYQHYRTVPLPDETGEVARILAVVENITERKKATLALNESETKYRDLVENSVLGMALYFKNEGYQFSNKRFSEITGYSREEIESPGFDFAGLFSKDDEDLINANTLKRLSGYEIPPYILPLTTKDKIQKYVEIHNVMVTYQGKPAIQIQLLDVTEKKQAEKALLNNLSRTKKLQEIVERLNRADTLDETLNIAIEGILSAINADRASVLLADADGIVRFKAWEGLSAAYRASTEGHFPWKLNDLKADPICIPDIARADMTSELRSCILKEGIHACSFIPLVGKEQLLGKFMVYYDQVHNFEADELNIARVLADNLAAVLERLQSNAALAASEERYRSTIESMKDLIFIINKEGYFIDYYAPDSSERLLTIPEVFLNQKFRDVLPEHVTELLTDAMVKLEAGDRSVVITYPMDIKGVELWFEAKLTARRNPEGKYIGVTGVVGDITARKRAEKQLELIMEGTATETGEGFFKNLVRCIAQAMEMDIAFITRRQSGHPTTVRSIAMWQKEQLTENFTWKISNSPCKRVLAGETVVIRDAVQRKFPKDHWLQQTKAKSYMAVPLLDKEGIVIGHLGVLNSLPITAPHQLARIINIFAVRAATELQRLQAEEELNSIFKSNPLPVMVVDETNTILTANMAAQNYMNLMLTELTGARPGEVLPCIHHLDDPKGCGFGPD
ncbi:MAG: PAS domain S-box protein, partial [FCB group bacterium]|nr:PAS domain S-box protein [FCB group bacterium]